MECLGFLRGRGLFIYTLISISVSVSDPYLPPLIRHSPPLGPNGQHWDRQLFILLILEQYTLGMELAVILFCFCILNGFYVACSNGKFI